MDFVAFSSFDEYYRRVQNLDSNPWVVRCFCSKDFEVRPFSNVFLRTWSVSTSFAERGQLKQHSVR